MSQKPAAPLSRSAYPHFLRIPTRWKDNDIYGHVNNVVYYSYFDTAINEWLIREGGLDIHGGETIGITPESFCQFRASFSFPEVVEAGVAVGRLGRSSVTYLIGLFKEGLDEAAATGHFVHVFVDRRTMRPAEAMPAGIRACLERLVIDWPTAE
ncbi:(3S)-malyl-CoA thioesterase [Tistlia consotensis]|uniref:(3S)-malyl-CoA thioesterase n=1 Tax=Tistlia consotensis USBA 355 TaxID=560819 RepID=A0A1Y6BX13_9PROT|nr:thioesterase family protein [Tistlia consotensis]SMF33094.1 (3S)-malyl-CoA thioesterase [Tistlia consotensis USBA 355]SNR69320.1 (3S)-malyl-CoA thioesterase [Tistlia consotensis]